MKPMGWQRAAWLLAVACCAVPAAAQQGKKAQEPTVWRKPGLWEVRLWPEGKGTMHSVRVLQCSAPEVEPTTLMSIVPGQEHCSTTVTRPARDTLRALTLCKVHDLPIQAVLEIRGDRSKAYEGHFMVRGDGASGPAKMVFSAQWLGACEAPMLPGHMQLPNGARVDTMRDKSAREAGHQH